MTEYNLTITEPNGLSSLIQSPSSLDTIVSIPENSSIVLMSEVALKSEIVVQQIVSTIVAGQGPSGPSGTGENVPYSKRTDFVGSDTIYKGEANPGSVDTDPVWRISKLVFVGEDITETWAEGTAEFNHMWSDHLTLVYN